MKSARTARTVRKVIARAPTPQGWHTTDEQEIELRQLRAATEPMTIRALDGGDPFHGAFAVQSKSKRLYTVEIRSLQARENSCGCTDFRVNGLGSCKHIEAVLGHLRKKGRKAFEAAARTGPACAEVYLSRKGSPEVRLLMPPKAGQAVRTLLDPFFDANHVLLANPADAIPALLRAWKTAPKAVRDGARISRDVEEWGAELARRQARIRARESFLADVKAGKRTLDMVRHKLYPYQIDGMLHLAFGERAMLADEMGLGKTVQAVAACELLRQTRRIERVLVVSPASLKAEWEEQIAKFTGLSSKIVWGRRADRLRAYREKAFFYLCNYEQARSDVADINQLVAPDVVILDEAQRIKNWQTQTANRIKQLASPYAFVLTGTPLENRIDEVYSIVQFLDPSIFGPLFRFNREFYALDEKGRPAGLKNIAGLHSRLRPIMLRRRKDEVEDQLPERTIKNYFVAMEPEQRKRYAEYEYEAARLASIAKRRPLTKEEMEKLQIVLGCMRMLCDTPHILDPKCRICPKLGELGDILDDVLSSGDSKIIVFSEWERMLELARDLAGGMKLGHAWHTGSVPQQKRRLEINRFKQDPTCRLFLSTDSGATGLNLQAANVVINLDLPWNPAKLEQRIARAWRKHQTRAVQVINLVCQDSIEHRMLDLLADKQELADGVLDGRGDLGSIKLPGGRAVFLARMQALLGENPATPRPSPVAATVAAEPTKAAPDTVFRQDLAARLGSQLVSLEARRDSTGRTTMLAVVDAPPDQTRPLAERLLRESFGNRDLPALEVLDRNTYETIQRLIRGGILKSGSESMALFQGAATADTARQERERRLKTAQTAMDQALRKAKMSGVLNAGGFVVEALPSLHEAVELSLQALLHLGGRAIGAPATLDELAAGPIADAGHVVAGLRELGRQAGSPTEPVASGLLTRGNRVIEQVQQAIARHAMG